MLDRLSSPPWKVAQNYRTRSPFSGHFISTVTYRDGERLYRESVMCWQVQIYLDEIGEWYGWGSGGYAGCYGTRDEAKPELKAAKRAGWTTRLVQVKDD